MNVEHVFFLENETMNYFISRPKSVRLFFRGEGALHDSLEFKSYIVIKSDKNWLDITWVILDLHVQTGLDGKKLVGKIK